MSSEHIEQFDAIILGAGGAGMMCALQAGRRNKRVLLIDHSETIGRKIMISGGGRCNFTNIYATAENYFCQNPHFSKSALSRYTPTDFIAMVKEHRIAFHEKKLGQLFCDGSAGQIVNMLLDECARADVTLKAGCRILEVRHHDEKFVIDTSCGTFHTVSLVVATGGLSIPKIGATGFGYEIARQFNIKVTETSPALVGFDLKPTDQNVLADLSGVSFDSSVSAGKICFRENTLFTHTGISGPAILQASLYWKPGDALSINTMPEKSAADWLLSIKKTGSRKELKNVLSDVFPMRFAEKLCQIQCRSRPIADISDKELRAFAEMLNNWKVSPARTFGYQKAEVTRGGVSTSELSSQTLQAKKVPNLYFIGEVTDVTGWLGGYNFQWAWSSGFVAAQAV